MTINPQSLVVSLAVIEQTFLFFSTVLGEAFEASFIPSFQIAHHTLRGRFIYVFM